jgi:hypothetical protein
VPTDCQLIYLHMVQLQLTTNCTAYTTIAITISVCLYIKQRKAEEAKKDASVEKTTTSAEIDALKESVDAFAARYPNVKGIEEYSVKAKSLIPKKYKGSLQRAFLLAQAQAMAK